MFLILVTDAEKEPPQQYDEVNSDNNFTAIVFAVVSLIVYILFLRPTTDDNNGATRNQAAQAMAGQRTAGGRRRTGNTNNAAAMNRLRAGTGRPAPRAKPLSDSAVEVLSKCQTKPQHVKNSTKATDIKIGGSNVLMDGMVAFGYTQAAENSAATAASSDAKRAQVKERAKILSQLLKQCSATTPPPKGSNLVIGLSEKNLADAAEALIISKVVANLATNYTVLVIVQVDSSLLPENNDYATMQKLQEKMVKQLRQQSTLTEAILPSHRILLSAFDTGRIALVRQLATVDLVVDFDPEVQSQLERFGYKVAVLPQWQSSFGWMLSS
ncbi:MAG: hypothetical protein SGILL_000644 [Bacillariaceae sp.]